MRFDPQTITVTDNKDRPYSLDARVAVQDDGTPVGLAAHPVYDLGSSPMKPRPDEYTLTYVPGGVRLHRAPVQTAAVACHWLALVAPLANWTRSRETLHTIDTLRLRVWMARGQALTECEGQKWEASPVSTFPVFRLASLAPLLEWISEAMEYVSLPREAKPALDALLDWHTEVARASTALRPCRTPCPFLPPSCSASVSH